VYQQGRRAKLRAVPSLPSEPPSTAVEDAVRRQLNTLPGATDRPGLAAGALAMARILDNPLAVPQQPAAAGQLFSILATLGKGSHRRGQLAVVKAMTASTDRPGQTGNGTVLPDDTIEPTE